MVLVFLHGLPGVGKLTVGRALAERTDLRLFHNHLTVDLATAVFDFGTPGFVALRELVWLETFRRAAEEDVSLIFTFAAERTVEGTFPERAAATVEAAGGTVAFVELRCDPAELRRRVASPDRRAFGKLASAETLDALVEEGAIYSLEPPAGRRALSFDTTARDAAAVAGDILEELDLGATE